MKRPYQKLNHLHDVIEKIFNDIEILPLDLMRDSKSQ